MGNSASSATISNSELAGDMLHHMKFFFEEELRGCRYIKTSRCLQNEAKHIVKAVSKSSAPAEMIDRYKAEVDRIHKVIQEQPVCRNISLRIAGESARAVYACRPYVYTDIRRRSTSRPFLVQQERLLIVHGVLLAVEQLHHAGIVHGDIKSSNVLLTSTNLVFLSDITPWKPVMLPSDNTAQLSIFFETDIDVRCSVAPERFYEAGTGVDLAKRASSVTLTPSMDIFSVGCLIYEILTDKPLFGLPELRLHSEGKFNLDAALLRLSLKPLSNIIKKCVDLSPSARLNIFEILDLFRSLVPQAAAFESFIEPTLRTSATMIARERLQTLVLDRSIWLQPESKDLIVHAVNIAVASSGSSDSEARSLVADSLFCLAPCCDNDTLLQRVVPCCVQLMAEAVGQTQVKFINTLLLACKCVSALPAADSEIMRLYILPAFSKAASVQETVDSSRNHMLDSTAACPRDSSSPLPQMHIAMRIHEIAAESLRFVELSARAIATVWAPAEGARPGSEVASTRFGSEASAAVFSAEPSDAAPSAAVQLAVETYEMRVSRMREDIVTLLMGLLKASFVGTQVAILNNVVSLGSVLGRKLFKEVVLPHMVALLNSPSYLVRAAFFSVLSNMALVVGGRTVKQIYLPLYERQLSTEHNQVELEVTLKGLLQQADAGLALRDMLLPLVKCAAPFLLHYSSSIRVLAMSFICTVAEKLGEVESRIVLLPNIRRFFSKDPVLLQFDSCMLQTAPSASGCLKPPITSEAFHFAAQNFNSFLEYCKEKNPEYCKAVLPLQLDHDCSSLPAHGVGSKPQPKPPILWSAVIKDDIMLFGCAQLVGNIRTLAASSIRRRDSDRTLEGIVSDEWLQEEWNASFWDVAAEQTTLVESGQSSSFAGSVNSGQNPFLMRSVAARVLSPPKASPFIDGTVVGALTTLNSRIVALLPSPDFSWLVAVSSKGDVSVYDCIGLLDEAFVAPFALHLPCEVYSASATLIPNSYPHVGFVAIGSDKGFVHIISIEVIGSDHAARPRAPFATSANSSSRSDVVLYKLMHTSTISMECDSGHILSVCAYLSTQHSVSGDAASDNMGSSQDSSSWRVLSYCTGKSYIAHWKMRGTVAPSKPPRRIELDRVLGGVLSIAPSPCGLWMAAGTSRGYICICDLRFSVLVKKIFTGSDTMLSAIAICSAPIFGADTSFAASRGSKSGWFGNRQRPSSKFGPLSPPGVPLQTVDSDESEQRVWVVVPCGGAGGDSVSAYNVSTGFCDAKFEITRGQGVSSESRDGSFNGSNSSISAKNDNSEKIAKDRYGTQLLQSQSVLPLVRAISIAATLGDGSNCRVAGGMFTAGSDRHLRYWSFSQPEQSSCCLLPPLASTCKAQSEIFAYRCENGCALFSAQPQEDSDRTEASSMQQKYRKGLDALTLSSVGGLVGVTAMCMLGR
jgi:serine/threonine protein kinase